MAEKKPKNVFQWIVQIFKDFVEWLEATFHDPELAAEIKDDLGLDPTNPATPASLDDATKAKIDAFVAKEDIDQAAVLAMVADLKTTFETVMTFVDAIRADGVDPRTLFWALFKLFAVDVLRVRNPAGYAFARLAGFLTEDDETLTQLDPASLTELVRGEGTAADGEALVQRLSMFGGLGVVITANLWDKLGGVIDPMYGWDPDPEDEGEAAVIASRALTIVLDSQVSETVRPAITIIGVPTGQGGPGVFVSISSAFHFDMDTERVTYTMDVAGPGQIGALIRGGGVDFTGGGSPSMRIAVEPKSEGASDPGPALTVGTTDATRLEIGRLAYGVEIADDNAAFQLGVKKGRLVIALGDGDSFLRQLPGGNIEVPFEIAMIGDTTDGLRFQGGTGVKVNLPIAASVFGVFTVQFLELELKIEPAIALEIRGGFSFHIGPFAASIDRVGMTVALSELGDGIDGALDLISFAPPKGIGLVLDSGPVKGGGYFFIDEDRGEYAGALELKFASFSIKAIGLLSTKRPDGSDGWSLLIFIFGQFSIHLGYNIFWTGLGGMVGLHHKADVDALSAGMRTGALDDVLFPKDPVADAPRIINRYRTLFPVEESNFLIGPMLELSFSKPPVVYVRLGVIVDIRNAVQSDTPSSLSKVILLGQVLVQLPPKETKAPAVLKLLIDIVGFYDAETQFLLIRARLRDSFVGIEKVAKINLSGELLIAVQFGADPNYVLSAGGFHPKYEGLPARVPQVIGRLMASFKIGVVELTVEEYFAVTPNSVQAGQRVSLKADFGIASIAASLGWDALLYLSPRFYFIVDLQFKAKVKAFGKTLTSVTVTATLRGPDLWHIKGTFSFSVLWWDKTVPFEESWGEEAIGEVGTVSLPALLRAELTDPDNLTAELPVGGVSPVTLTSRGDTETVAHPLGRLAIRQRAVPFNLDIDRIGTEMIAGGKQRVSIDTVTLNGNAMKGFDATTESFAKGQFIELSEEERLTGKVFEPYPNGVVVGAGDYHTNDKLGRDVQTAFETVRLDPEPGGIITKWSARDRSRRVADYDSMVEASRIGAAARSDRALMRARIRSSLAGSAVSVADPPLAMVTPGTLAAVAEPNGTVSSSPTLAQQDAAAAGWKLVERFEVVR
jgi:hypothetical protein